MKMMRAPLVLALLGASVAFAQVPGRFSDLTAKSVNGVITVTGYGAKCDGTTNDTAAFQAATNAAGAAFAATGKPTVIEIPYGASGQCLLGGTVFFKSGSYWRGKGGSVLVTASGVTPFQSFVTSDLTSGDVSYVEFADMTINQTTAGSAVGIFYLGGIGTTGGGTVSTQKHFYVKNSNIKGAGYAIIVEVYNQNEGNNHHLSDVQLTGNHISCDLVTGNLDSSCRDGIHVAGDLSDFHVDGNTVANRDDAALALTSTGSSNPSTFPSSTLARLTPTNGTVSNNVCDNNGIGLDNSGGANVQEVGNRCVSTSAMGPALRFIFDQYPLPTNINVVGGAYAASGASLVDASVKMDYTGSQSAGFFPLCNCTISGSELGGSIYMTGNTFTLTGNTFDPGASVSVNSVNGYQTQAINFVGNTWAGTTRTITTSTIQGSIISSRFVRDYFNGAVKTFPIVASSTTFSYSSLPVQDCGSAYTSGGQTVDCVSSQATYGGGANPAVTHATTHTGSTGGAVYTWDGAMYAQGQQLCQKNSVGCPGVDYYWTFTSCANGTGQPSRCAGTTTLPGAMPDATYTLACSVAGTDVSDQVIAIHTLPLPTASGGSISYAMVQLMQNATAGGATFTVMCHAHHN